MATTVHSAARVIKVLGINSESLNLVGTHAFTKLVIFALIPPDDGLISVTPPVRIGRSAIGVLPHALTVFGGHCINRSTIQIVPCPNSKVAFLREALRAGVHEQPNESENSVATRLNPEFNDLIVISSAHRSVMAYPHGQCHHRNGMRPVSTRGCNSKLRRAV